MSFSAGSDFLRHGPALLFKGFTFFDFFGFNDGILKDKLSAVL